MWVGAGGPRGSVSGPISARPDRPAPRERHLSAAMIAEEALVQYDRYIHREAWRCARKLPRETVYTHEDLVGEGQEQLLRCLQGFDASKGWKLITYFGVCLGRRYGRLVHAEWKQRGGGLVDPEVLARIPDAPAQDAMALLATVPSGELAEALGGRPRRRTVSLPQRYTHLRRPAVILSAAPRPPRRDCPCCAGPTPPAVTCEDCQ